MISPKNDAEVIAAMRGILGLPIVVENDQGLHDKAKAEYSHMVSVLAKPGAVIAASLTAEMAHLIHMAIGVAGEAGELLDAVKKAAIYLKPIDRMNVVEELGDLEFYMEGLRQGLDITREEVLRYNVNKLSTRYKGLKYSDTAAQQRADKAEETTKVGPLDAVHYAGPAVKLEPTSPETFASQSFPELTLGKQAG
jgi:NTP pyrophosphatase (non-canonical NTP hydrolase)